MIQAEEEALAQGTYISAAIAVGGLGVIGLIVGGALAFTGGGEPSMVEAQGMLGTATLLCVVGGGLWWGGSRQITKAAQIPTAPEG
ncbi:MAG TPA: hypothetical protein DFR83_01320 [Deltaproteobacteria bacterium]|nr:hypothetical protein [Deltaproteobacteria bacterium]